MLIKFDSLIKVTKIKEKNATFICVVLYNVKSV